MTDRGLGDEDDLYRRIMAVADTTPQRQRFTRSSASSRLPTMTMPMRAAAVVVIAVLAVVGLFYVNRSDKAAIGGPSPTPGATASSSPAAVVGPSATPSAMAGPTPTPLKWTQASLKEGWPGPVRPEPAGAAIFVPLKEKVDNVVPDPLGDTGSAAHPWVDIKELRGNGSRITIDLGSLPPDVAPAEQWFAWGVVVDDDRDGIPDRRFGIDNIGGHRAWTTDLHTGRTGVGWNNGVAGTHFETWFPGSVNPWGNGAATLHFGGEFPGGGGNPGLGGPFYAWASVIENGRVVATDYAPDVGWLDPSPKAKP
jgi:hypothetical protein